MGKRDQKEGGRTNKKGCPEHSQSGQPELKIRKLGSQY
tara:strand:- start:47 stop:160 length:114 start_codon:yes stop_codon:yes gene_type:complete